MTHELSRLNAQRGPTRAEVEYFRSTLPDLTEAELHTLYRTCGSRSYQDAGLLELEQRKRNSQE